MQAESGREWQEEMVFGDDPGSVVLRDSRIPGSDSIELDLSAPANRLWRFRGVRGAKR